MTRSPSTVPDLGRGGLAQPYVSLLERLAPLNRVHNGPDMTLAMEYLANFCRGRLRGSVTIHNYQPGDVHNHWIVPPHWTVERLRLIGPDGETIARETDHPLVVTPYSASAKVELDLEELRPHLVSRSDLPEAYNFHFRRMYRPWEGGWSIALPERIVGGLKPGRYRVELATTFGDAPMPVFEYVLPGRTDRTIVMAAHVDHPGQVNDSLSGCIACLQGLEELERLGDTEYTYRILLVPEIIGSAVFLKANEHLVDQIQFAFCPNMTAHAAPLALCLSKSQRSLLDLALQLALKERGSGHLVGAFHKYPDCGDEISFDAVGYGIPTSTLSRVGEMFAYYHSSHDDLQSFLNPDFQSRHQDFVSVLAGALGMLEANRVMRPRFRGNPCLSNPALDLYLGSSNINNRRVAEQTVTDLDGVTINKRALMERFLDALDIEDYTLLEAAFDANVSFDLMADYARQFAAKELVDLETTARRFRVDRRASTSLTSAGLV